MKPEAQRIAIAEWHGWKYKSADITGNFDRWLSPKEEFNWALYSDLPDYLTDLNAMHEVEEKLRENQFYFVAYPRELFKVVSGTDLDKDGLGYFTFNFIHTAAAQRAEALLRTIGKWVDEPKGEP